MITIKLSHTAVGGLNRGYLYYERKEAGLGDYFKNTLLAEIEGLTVTAGIHRMIRGHHRMISRVFPYAIYYKFSGQYGRCARSHRLPQESGLDRQTARRLTSLSSLSFKV